MVFLHKFEEQTACAFSNILLHQDVVRAAAAVLVREAVRHAHSVVFCHPG